MLKNYFWLSLFMLAGLTACSTFDDIEDLDNPDYEAEFAVPLIDTRLSMHDILENFEENASLTIDPDGLIRFRYSGDVITKSSAEVFAAINATVSQGVIPITSNRQALPFAAPSGLDMDRLDLKTGKLVYLIQNIHNESITVTFMIPEVTLNGVPFSFTTTVPAYSGTGDPPQTANLFTPIQLGGHLIQPVNDSIYIEYEAIDATGDMVTLGPTGLLINDLSFSYAEGYLGNQLYEGGRDTIVIDFFDNWVRGDVYFEEPKITFNFENSFGIPTRSIINLFNVFTVRGDVLPLESEFITNGIDFPYPTLDEIGQVKTTSFVFTKENSNIDIVLGAGPIAIDYDVNAFTNPEMNSTIRGFITDSSYYKVRVDVELPLYGNAVDFVARDTFDIDFSKFEEVKAAEFKLVTDNGLPLSIDVQGYFLDDNGMVLDSLLGSRERVINSAPVDGQGHVIQPKQQITYAPFDEARFAGIRDAKRLSVVAAFSTYNDGNVSVRVLADQQVQVRLGAKLKIKNE
ncbi:MAG: hypothetical protein IPN33_24945 [Saprospiraceae bacterium]|nr:hypothetical protein [Saprospiraceae bacterium]